MTTTTKRSTGVGDLLISIRDVVRQSRKAVKRNQQRFPPDFMFQLSDEEASGLILQSGISKLEHRLEGHDQAIGSLFDVIRQLMAPRAKPQKQICRT